MITANQIRACVALLTTRRTTNGYADLSDLREAAEIPAACHTEEEAAARANNDLDLHEALVARSDVAFYRGEYRLLA